MVAPTAEVPGPKVGTFNEPPCPLPPDLTAALASCRAAYPQRDLTTAPCDTA